MRRPRSATLRRRPGALGELWDAALEQVEERIVGRSGEAALVGALEEDRGLPQCERRVPADVGHRAPGDGLVARDHLVARGEAGSAGDVMERDLEVRVAG